MIIESRQRGYFMHFETKYNSRILRFLISGCKFHGAENTGVKPVAFDVSEGTAAAAAAAAASSKPA